MVEIIKLDPNLSLDEDKNLKKLKELCQLEKVVITYGHFSSIHPGHIRYLQNARDYGDKLVVILIGDGKANSANNYQFTSRERSQSLALLNLCDYIVELVDKELQKVVNILHPERIIFGTDYKFSKEKEIIDTIKVAGEIKTHISYDSGEIVYASTDLLKDRESALDKKRKEQLIKACKCQSVDITDLCTKIDQFRNIPILIIGDSIIDEYSACEALGMSSEAPVVVVKELETEIYYGGAAIVALHINELGGKCHFISVTGQDHLSKKLEKFLNGHIYFRASPHL